MRQLNLSITNATSGTPSTLENFAAESKMAVERARSVNGNQWPVAFWLAGKAGASATPSSTRAAMMPPKPLAIAVRPEAMTHRNALARPTRVTPNRSRIMPPGTCSSE